MSTNPTPLDTSRTQRFRNHRTGRMEMWEAVSADGRWSYRRLEMPTTPWQAVDLWSPDSEPEWFGTLRSARSWTATQPAVECPAVTR